MNNLEQIRQLPPQYTHASNLVTKWESGHTTKEQRIALNVIGAAYWAYITQNNHVIGYSDDNIHQRVEALNTYYNFLHENKYDNLFTAQSKFRPTILEEFIFILFKDYVEELKRLWDNNIDCLDSGSVKAYTNLFFKAKDFGSFINNLGIGVNTKDQDYAIYRSVNLTINQQTAPIKIPAVAIEAKTYIDKTMLDSIIATAEKLKSGNPYARFVAIAEHYDVGADVDPAYSRIDQIYILRKCRRRDWANIDSQVVLRVFREIKQHIERPWSNIEE